MYMASNIANLYFRSKKISLIILAVTAVICSRLLFFFFKDTEGPNLLIVMAFATALYLSSLAVYIYGPFKMGGIKRLLAAVCVQAIAVTGLYLCMK